MSRNTLRWIVLLLFAVLTVTKFSQRVRTVDVVGLVASGALAGVAICGLVRAVRTTPRGV